ncbi:MAG: DNA polymerase III subunit beta [Candidatus Lariskella arthropodorum]
MSNIRDDKMHIQVEKKLFLKALNKVQGVVDKKHALPILANVKITAKDDKIELYTTDTEMSVISTTAGEIISPGVATAPAQMLCEIIKKMPDDLKIQISKVGTTDSLLIKTEVNEFVIPSLPADTFPDFDAGNCLWKLNLDANSLYMLLSFVRHAMSTEEIRYYLNGIYLHIESVNNEKRLFAVATDSHRMAVVDIAIQDTAEEFSGIILPKKTVAEILNILSEAEEEVELEFCDNKIALVTNGTKLISKLIDGKFPEYKKAIPPQSTITATVPAQDLSRAIDLVTTITIDKKKSVKLLFDKQKLQVTVNTQNNSHALQNISGITYNGDSMLEIAFNSRYIMDILSLLNGFDIEFSLSSSNPAVSIRCSNYTNVFFILMPMEVTA